MSRSALSRNKASSTCVLRAILLVITGLQFDVIRMEQRKVRRCSPGAHIPLLYIREVRYGWVNRALGAARDPTLLLGPPQARQREV